MAVKATVSSRKLKSSTGIEISVPSFEPAPTPKQVKNYHVVVITKLPFFKLPEHSEDEVVQFMVPRDYDAFEILQKELVDECHIKLPDLPRKFHVFMSDDDIQERQVSFDCLLKVLARDKEKCTCAPLLRFLQVPLDADKIYFSARKEYLQKKEKLAEKAQAFLGKDETSLFDECEKEPDPFPVQPVASNYSSGARQNIKVTLQRHEDGELPVFVPKEALVETAHTDVPVEDNSDLLNVSESLDDVLQITTQSDTKRKQKKQTQSTGMKSVPPNKGVFDVEDDNDANNLGTDDILQYIKQETSKDADNDDLF